MKITVTIRLEFRGHQGLLNFRSRWKRYIEFRGVLNSNSRPARGDDLFMLIYQDKVEYCHVDVTHLIVESVSEEIKPEMQKGGYVPSLWVVYVNKGKLILKGVSKQHGLDWVEEVIVPRMKFFGFEVHYRSYFKSDESKYI